MLFIFYKIKNKINILFYYIYFETSNETQYEDKFNEGTKINDSLLNIKNFAYFFVILYNHITYVLQVNIEKIN